MPMLVGMIVYEILTTYLLTIATVMGIAAGGAMAMQQRGRSKSAREAEKKAIGDKEAKEKNQARGDKAYKDSLPQVVALQEQEQRRSNQLQQEAFKREKASKFNRTLKERQKAFGNQYASRDNKTEEFDSVPLLASNKFGKEQDIFKPYNFGVENFNNNF